jgi:hypothetical protein
MEKIKQASAGTHLGPRHFKALRILKRGLKVLATSPDEVDQRLKSAWELHLRQLNKRMFSSPLAPICEDLYLDIQAACSQGADELTKDVVKETAEAVFDLYHLVLYGIQRSL